VVGEPYGTIFHMVPDPANRNRASYLFIIFLSVNFLEKK
jgi:hypothetical protein